MRARALIFDLDDTLYPYDAFLHSGFRAVAAYLAGTVGADAREVFDTLQQASRRSRGRELQILLHTRGWPSAWVARLRDVVRFHRPVVEPWPDTRPTLARLRAEGWRLAILTNGPITIQRAKVRSLGLGPDVDVVVYAEACAPGGKPAREAFEQTLARLQVEGRRAVMVGDDLDGDVHGARAAGLHAVHLVRGLHAREAGESGSVSTLADAALVAGRLVGAGEPVLAPADGRVEANGGIGHAC